MGRKGPIVILLLGIAAMAAFALMGKALMDQNPLAGRIAQYKQSLVRDFPLERALLIRRAPQDWELRLTVERDRAAAFASAAADRLPPEYDGVLAHFRRGFSMGRPPREVLLVFFSPGGGCRGEEELWSRSFTPAAERGEIQQEMTKEAGGLIQFRMYDAEALALQSKVELSDEVVKKLVARALTFYGGRWREVSVRAGRKRMRFDGEGRPLEP